MNGKIDTMTSEIEEEAEELVKENTREELNEMAREEGIKEPEDLPRKKAVAMEIVRARKAKEYVRRPTGLYFER
ncbi:MAG: hypothetical protein V5A88_07190 [Candidatus Thermoplasmatota archaeon]